MNSKMANDKFITKLSEWYNIPNVTYVSHMTYTEFYNDFDQDTDLEWNNQFLQKKAAKDTYYKQVINLCKEVLQSVKDGNNGCIEVTYGYGLNNSCGRQFKSRKGLTLQKLGNKLRSFLCEGVLSDYDMKNAHPTLLLQICKEQGIIETSWLAHYVKNRTEFLEKFNITKWDFLAKFNKDKIYGAEKGSDLHKMFSELKNIKKQLIEKLEPEAEFNIRPDAKNPISSFINKLLCKRENEELMKAIDNSGLAKDQVSVLMFDGFMAKAKFDPKILNSEYLEWTEKPIYSGIKIPEGWEPPNTDYEDCIVDDKPFQTVSNYIETVCKDKKIAIHGSNIMIPDKPMSMKKFINPYTQKPITRIDYIRLVYQECQNKEIQYCIKIVEQQSKTIKIVEAMDSINYKQYTFDRKIYAFNNGYLNIDDMQFCEYEENVEYDNARAAFDKDFDTSLLEQKWKDINCGEFDSIIDYQLDDEDAKLFLYYGLGRLNYHVNEKDKHNAILQLFGTNGTGKSQIVETVMYLQPETTTISSNETTFALMPLATAKNPTLLVDPDTPKHYMEAFEKSRFQKYTEGKELDIAIKGGSITKHLATAPILLASQYALSTGEKAGELSGRICRIDFNKPVDPDTAKAGDVHEIIRDKYIDAVIVKTLKAYEEVLKTYGANTQFRKMEIPYFENQREMNMADINPIQIFLDKPNCNYEKDSSGVIDFNEFKADFEAIMSTDKKEVKLSANDSGLGNQGLFVKRIQTCKICGLSRDKKYMKQCNCIKKENNDRIKRFVLIGMRKIKEDDVVDVDDTDDL